ncbi:hypothetical protein NP945_31095 [Mesorhizobium sp. LMG17149]|jgi:hypothetical protein|uniref:hypothetical protein n=1 Tax=Mesorhizobium sp. LMG17149 TaxID=2968497 RepID=UPI002117815D|nr:hypothetical protein [Mesorhizobium sp. LMG17149]MCQ8876292.1 hypothetical protein [Mesorhizobium sp. LMG17149]
MSLTASPACSARRNRDGNEYLDAEAKAELHYEAVKLIAHYDGPLETVKALMAYNCELETQMLAIAHRHPGIVSI